MTSMNGPSARDSASGKSARDAGPTDGQPPRAQFLTVAEVASLMRVSKMTVYRLVHNGELPAVRVLLRRRLTVGVPASVRCVSSTGMPEDGRFGS